MFVAYWLCRKQKNRNRILLASSYVFYGWWDWRFLGLILISSLVDYQCGLKIGSSAADSQKKRWLAVSLCVNLGLLCTFKYLNFFAESTATMLQMLGYRAGWSTLHVVLPVGISFYTFQTLSYTIDVYRGKCDVCSKPLDFFLFVAFFPQLVAGPIEKAHILLPQLQKARRLEIDSARHGLRCILYGFLLKSVVADNLTAFVDGVYNQPESASGFELLMATYGFAFQIYGDFAGYTWIAIGCAALFGIRLTQNFRSPYLSESPREFWHRWHISLSAWFSEYVYIGLFGGARVSGFRHVLNILLTFLISGLWHGANWTFVIWGGLNGILYFVAAPFRGSWWSKQLNAMVCFHMICATWILFRADSVATAMTIFERIAYWSPTQMAAGTVPSWYPVAIIPLCVVGMEIIGGDSPGVLQQYTQTTRWLIYSLALFALFFLGVFDRTPYIYFQF